MQFAKVLLGIVSIFGACPQAQPPTTRSKRIVIGASTVLDGKGRVLHDTRIVIENSKIVALDPKAGPVDYDLRGLTVLPGWIDAHVHITGVLTGKERTPAARPHRRVHINRLRMRG